MHPHTRVSSCVSRARPRSSPPGNNTAIVETLSVPNADCFFTINQLVLIRPFLQHISLESYHGTFYTEHTGKSSVSRSPCHARLPSSQRVAARVCRSASHHASAL